MRDNIFTISLTVSMLLHLCALYPYVILKSPPPPPPAVGTSKVENNTVNVTLVPAGKPGLQAPTASNGLYPSNSSMCTGKGKTFLGIGIKIGLNDVIIDAPSYYPGYKAGLRTGDYISNATAPMIDGYVTFNIERGREHIKIRIKADTICFTE